MPNRTLYINTKNWERFATYDDKSKLINNLLERHYYGTVSGGKTQEDVKQDIAEAQAIAAFNGDVCTGHTMRMDCGRVGCKYKNK